MYVWTSGGGVRCVVGYNVSSSIRKMGGGAGGGLIAPDEHLGKAG